MSDPIGALALRTLQGIGDGPRAITIDIGKGDQFKPEFLAVAPNNRIPAMVDHEPKGGGKPISIFESGAMLLYLAEKTGKFLPAKSDKARGELLSWMFFVSSGVGPYFGQAVHFRVHGYGDEEFAGKVRRLNPAANPTTRQVEVLVDFVGENQPNTSKPRTPTGFFTSCRGPAAKPSIETEKAATLTLLMV